MLVEWIVNRLDLFFSLMFNYPAIIHFQTGVSSVSDSAGNKDGLLSRRGKLKERGWFKELNADFEVLGVRRTRKVEPENSVTSPEAKVPSNIHHSASSHPSFTVKEDDPTLEKKDFGRFHKF